QVGEDTVGRVIDLDLRLDARLLEEAVLLRRPGRQVEDGARDHRDAQRRLGARGERREQQGERGDNQYFDGRRHLVLSPSALPAPASSFLTSFGSRASGAVMSALSSARSEPIGHGSCSRGKSCASRATRRLAFSALAVSTLMMSCTVTASWSGCQQSKSVTMATVA